MRLFRKQIPVAFALVAMLGMLLPPAVAQVSPERRQGQGARSPELIHERAEERVETDQRTERVQAERDIEAQGGLINRQRQRARADRLGQDQMAQTPEQREQKLVSANELIGLEVQNEQGQELGQLEEIVLTSGLDRAEYGVLSTAGRRGIGEKLFAVPFSAYELQERGDEDDLLVLNVQPQQLEQAEGFEQDAWPVSANRQWADQGERHEQMQDRMQPGQQTDQMQTEGAEQPRQQTDELETEAEQPEQRMQYRRRDLPAETGQQQRQQLTDEQQTIDRNGYWALDEQEQSGEFGQQAQADPQQPDEQQTGEDQPQPQFGEDQPGREQEMARTGQRMQQPAQTVSPEHPQFWPRRVTSLIGLDVHSEQVAQAEQFQTEQPQAEQTEQQAEEQPQPQQQAQAEQLGELEDALIEMNTEQVAFGIISSGGVLEIGENLHAVPWQAMRIRPQQQVAVLNASQQQLEQFAVTENYTEQLAQDDLAQQIREAYDLQPYAQQLAYVPGEDEPQEWQGPRQEAWTAEAEFNKLYDPEQVQNIEGTIQSVGTFRPAPGAAEGVRLRIRTEDGQSYVVLAGPRTFAREQQMRVFQGDEVQVSGSQVEFGQQEVIMASEISHRGQTYRLRTQEGEPQWQLEQPQERTEEPIRLRTEEEADQPQEQPAEEPRIEQEPAEEPLLEDEQPAEEPTDQVQQDPADQATDQAADEDQADQADQAGEEPQTQPAEQTEQQDQQQ